MQSSNQLRQAFLDYFKRNGHTVVASSSLVPFNDPTLLFTNAGMVQFKDLFLGLEKREYTRAVSSQRCVRAGGKHNDLDQVGYTARHHTFFEMLGNFSFGDYFKKEAIEFAWSFLTKELNIPIEKLWITVFEDDNEAADIWQTEIGIPKDRIIRCGEKSNFWSMGDTGPCGPCTEIFYDHGSEVPGGPPGSPDEDGDRYVEIWNLVFMQFDRTPEGELKPLPKPSVDTGMGLERLTTVMQGKHNNYDTDIFDGILRAIERLCDCSDESNGSGSGAGNADGTGGDFAPPVTSSVQSKRVIADHIRSCSFLIVDGVIPSNEGRGYVLRRIIRRAIRHGHQLGIRDMFFYKLVQPLVEKMGEAYPELRKAQERIERILQQEENQFLKTLEQGLRMLEEGIAPLNGNIIPGETIFRLYDTYGFPPDLTNDIARERNLLLDMDGFEHEMTKQRVLSQQASKFSGQYQQQLSVSTSSLFTGYEGITYESTLSELFHAGQPVNILKAKEKDEADTDTDTGVVVLAHTPFYAESGGQVGDRGVLRSPTGVFQVIDTQKRQEAILHLGRVVEGYIQQNQMIHAEVDQLKREATALNHSATHLLHSALKQILGAHVQQKGSLVSPERLRFDFSHSEALSFADLQAVEALVNQFIHANIPVDTHVLSQEEAIARGAEALFGEKYGSQVRVLQMGDFSLELCGGTHAKWTGDIGLFRIVTESGIAAGVRRIEAVTGAEALAYNAKQLAELYSCGNKLRTNWENTTLKVDEILNQLRQAQKQIEQLSGKLAAYSSMDLLQTVESIQGCPVLIANVGNLEIKGLRELADQLKNRQSPLILLLGSTFEGKAFLLACVSKDLTLRVHANDLVNQAAVIVGGKGGGRAEQAQAGGTESLKLEQALQEARTWLERKLA
ncbi:MAG: alanine--tRNA ligase [Legionellales bacterium]|nr:alanine--tRNA ligase [Legionellales bacterium]